MRLTLVVPELLWPEPDDKQAYDSIVCPALEWLLARGKLQRASASPLEDTLSRLFNLDAALPGPFGALRLAGEAVNATAPSPRQSHWLCADPVHLRFHHERIVLADAGAFDLSEDEAHALIAALNREFGDIGHFHAATARRWYLRLNESLTCPTLPLSTVAGRRVSGELSAESGAGKLRQWQNEIQMFLHSHPINAERAASGRPAVNSLWLWGTGVFPVGNAASGFSAVRSDDPLTIGLARSQGIATHPLPDSLGAILQERPEHALITLDQLLGPVLYENSTDWKTSLEALDTFWFAPLKAALGGTVRHVTLIAPTIYGLLRIDTQGGDRWKIWRQPQPLPALARQLAEQSQP